MADRFPHAAGLLCPRRPARPLKQRAHMKPKSWYIECQPGCRLEDALPIIHAMAVLTGCSFYLKFNGIQVEISGNDHPDALEGKYRHECRAVGD